MAKDLEAQAYALSKAFLRKGVELDTLLKVAIDEACVPVEQDAVLLAPVDTSLLKKSIRRRVIDRNGYPVGQVGTTGAPGTTGYDYWQEFGTSKMRAQPYLLPAMNRNKSVVKMIIARRLKQAL